MPPPPVPFVHNDTQLGFTFYSTHSKPFVCIGIFFVAQSFSKRFEFCLPGQGCQVPADSGGKQDPQAGPLLQDQESTGPQLEVVRILNCVCLLVHVRC